MIDNNEFIFSLNCLLQEFLNYAYNKDIQVNFEEFIKFVNNYDDFKEEEKRKLINILDKNDKENKDLWKSYPITNKQWDIINKIVFESNELTKVPDWIVDRGTACKFISNHLK